MQIVGVKLIIRSLVMKATLYDCIKALLKCRSILAPKHNFHLLISSKILFMLLFVFLLGHFSHMGIMGSFLYLFFCSPQWVYYGLAVASAGYIRGFFWIHIHYFLGFVSEANPTFAAFWPFGLVAWWSMYFNYNITYDHCIISRLEGLLV